MAHPGAGIHSKRWCGSAALLATTLHACTSCSELGTFIALPGTGDVNVPLAVSAIPIKSLGACSHTSLDTVNPGGADAFASLNGAAVPAPNTPFYGRMMYYLESVPSNVHWTFIDATGPVPGTDYSATYRYGGQQPVMDGTTFIGSQLMANYETPDFYAAPPRGPNTDCYKNSDREIVIVGSWSCAEWFFDGPSMEMRFWLDGREIPSLHVDETGTGCQAQPSDYPWTAPEFNQIDVGWESYQTDEERSMWVDDVVISTTKIGCPATP